MSEEVSVAKTNTNEALLEKLASMENLLREQAEYTKKAAKSRKWTIISILALVVVFAVGLFWLNTTVASTTRQVPALIETMNSSAGQLQQTLRLFETLDMDAMNSAIREMETGLGNVNFEALNQSIVDLQKVAEGLREFMSIFG